MTRDQELRSQAYKEMEKNRRLVEEDPYRLKYHLMPPAGLLNDPNGFIEFNGVYHLYYQWMPFKTGHGAKFWGHYSSEDLVHWKHEEIALAPSKWYEKNGCYSGSAIEHEGKLYAFYTGNVKDDEGNRETYQCLAVSEDAVHFDKKGPVVDLPQGLTPHFRDPKVWEQDGRYFMVVGAQTEALNGAAALLKSTDLMDWSYEGIIAGGDNGKLGYFGYMFECPDLFSLDEQDILVFSPQGLEPSGIRYQNVYQAGYVIGQFDPEAGEYQHGEFDELDRGFDFYAPQTTLDHKGRRLLFAWMSVPDQNEQEHPTVEHKWLHCMTIPRELKLVDGKVHQVPLEELAELRNGKALEYSVNLIKENCSFEGVEGNAVELELTDISFEGGWMDIAFGDGCRVMYNPGTKLFTLERKSYVDGTVEKRQCQMEELTSLRVFLDTSSIEVFLNGGEECFTSRIYPSPNDQSITFSASGSTSYTLYKWSLTSP
ncbi:sucrose-6-phosphate hydrolase [Rossellomorea vietnamensis]|uniref:Sucrose-6-phosphate hydrolase n=1 Tax=Rossellomorea vietnamensis TaxID=218284 RepID=A0A5D4NJZ7_9BACI|nr:sucrose-6-phosphate hydrolase [Rossellomorea vietnamensis]TYS14084.1 sucrose-6-phosphate hydrolase [Rossellomorea vietnamensis]